MKNLGRWTGLAALAMAMLVNTGTAMAQDRGGGRGNFDPEEMRQRMMDRYREQLDVQDDAAWKLVEERITKVMEARRDAGGFGRGMAMMGRGARGGGQDQGGQGRRQGPPGFGGEPDPAAEALQKAVEDKASNDEVKAKLAKYRESRKAKQAKLAAAQEELRKIVTPRQEAMCVLMGLLD